MKWHVQIEDLQWRVKSRRTIITLEGDVFSLPSVPAPSASSSYVGSIILRSLLRVSWLKESGRGERSWDTWKSLLEFLGASFFWKPWWKHRKFWKEGKVSLLWGGIKALSEVNNWEGQKCGTHISDSWSVLTTFFEKNSRFQKSYCSLSTQICFKRYLVGSCRLFHM